MNSTEELKVASLMIKLFCKKRHKTKTKKLCPCCQELQSYVVQRLEKCPHGESRPFCSNCKIHCYKPDMRQKIKTVMRFSGPRMLLYHPVVALKHLKSQIQEKYNGKINIYSLF